MQYSIMWMLFLEYDVCSNSSQSRDFSFQTNHWQCLNFSWMLFKHYLIIWILKWLVQCYINNADMSYILLIEWGIFIYAFYQFNYLYSFALSQLSESKKWIRRLTLPIKSDRKLIKLFIANDFDAWVEGEPRH